jgi:hypothetical protein
MEQLYRWRGEARMAGSPPLGRVSALSTWEDAVSVLDLHLHENAENYPLSREWIIRVSKSLHRAAPGDWDGEFPVRGGLMPGVTVYLSIRKVNQMEMGMTPRPKPPASPPATRTRVGNAERTRYQEHLSTMYATGFLDKDEWERRYSLANSVVYEDELPPLLTELPPLPPPEPDPEPSKSDIVPGMRSPAEIYKARQTLVLLPLAGGLILTTCASVANLSSGAVASMQGLAFILCVIALTLGLAFIIRRK